MGLSYTPPQAGGTPQDMYEHREVWAEESTGLNAGGTEWSYGNGATGSIGIPVGPEDDWEITHMYFHANNYTANSAVTVDTINVINGTPSLCGISLANAADGGGSTDNAFKVYEYASPIPLPANTVIGFKTSTVSGSISNARVGVRLRRKIGEYLGA